MNATACRRILFVLGSLCLLLFFPACETTNPEAEAANAVFQGGDYEKALPLYEALLAGQPDPEERALAERRVAEIRDRLSSAAVNRARAMIGSVPTIPDLEEAIAFLESKREYDTTGGRIEGLMETFASEKDGLRERIAKGLEQAREATAIDRWPEALALIETVRKFDPGADKFAEARTAVLGAREKSYREWVVNAYEQQSTQGLKDLRQEALAEEPAVSPGLVRTIERYTERLREDLLPAEIDALVAENRYYEAVEVLKTSDRPETMEAYADLRSEAGQYYLRDAERALDSLPKLWGRAYFSAVKAAELDPDNQAVFDMHLRCRDHIDGLLQTKIGIAAFDSPENSTRSGTQFSDGLISSLNDKLPYGVSIADRAQLEMMLQEKPSARRMAFERESIDLLVRGNVSTLDVERKRNDTTDMLYVTIGYELVPNPLYREYREEYGSKLSRWPEELRDTPRQKRRAVRDQVALEKTYQYAKGLMVISVSLVDAERNIVLESFEDREDFFKEDTFHGAVPAAGIKEDPPELPSDFEITESLRKTLASRVAARILDFYADREKRMVAEAEQLMDENKLQDALVAYAKAHHFCRQSFTGDALPANEVYAAIANSILTGAAEEEAVFEDVYMPQRRTQDDFVVSMGGDAGSDKWGLIIGVSDYEDPYIPDVEFAATDASAFHDWLTSPEGGGLREERTRLLLGPDATLTNIKVALSQWLRNADQDDLVTIFLAGHGSPASPENQEDLYFIPYDAQNDAIAATSLPMDYFTESFEKFIQSDRVVLLADACHSGGIGSAFNNEEIGTRLVQVGAFNTENVASKMEEARENRSATAAERFQLAILSSARANQVSMESGGWGIFTRYLIEGLQSGADNDRDGKVTVDELFRFVRDSVDRETNGRQQPVLSGVNYEELVISELGG